MHECRPVPTDGRSKAEAVSPVLTRLNSYFDHMNHEQAKDKAKMAIEEARRLNKGFKPLVDALKTWNYDRGGALRKHLRHAANRVFTDEELAFWEFCYTKALSAPKKSATSNPRPRR